MKLINNEQKMLDIVFAERNKNYGAYAIRSDYGNTLFKSLFILFFTVVSALGLAMWLKESDAVKTEIGQIPTVITIPVDFSKPLEQKLEKPKTNPAPANNGGVKNNSSLGTVINNNATDTIQQTVNTNLLPINTSTNTGNELPNTGSSSLTSNGTGTTAISTTKTNEAYEVDENPEFEGGNAALLAFVRKNLVYPSRAVAENKQGTLYVKFVVDEAGKVSNILLQNNLGYGIDDEAMRVLKLIPKFKSPGKVKGQPVKTYYQIPIKFKLG